MQVPDYINTQVTTTHHNSITQWPSEQGTTLKQTTVTSA